MDIRLKFLAAILLFGAWGGLVLMHMTPVNDFVDTVRLALEALGIYHVILPTTQNVANIMQHNAEIKETSQTEPEVKQGE